jgi:predicted nucleic acid-binding Zn finger protein
MTHSQLKEIEILEYICHKIVEAGKLPDSRDLKLSPSFSKRYEKAVKIVERLLITKHTFNPSGRVIWTVKGKSREYQIIPQSNFCSCDDFYFRVMDYKRQVCYHLIAQRIANTLKLYNHYEMRDSEYDKIARKWRAKLPSSSK